MGKEREMKVISVGGGEVHSSGCLDAMFMVGSCVLRQRPGLMRPVCDVTLHCVTSQTLNCSDFLQCLQPHPKHTTTLFRHVCPPFIMQDVIRPYRPV
jgi:hypothetical protein